MTTIDLNLLLPHPDNANHMRDDLLQKLTAHLQRTSRYPSIIVRPHPETPEHFQILDGHHRTQALARLGHTTAQCQVWDVDDDEAALLLLTLNRLEGADDPQKRGALLQHLHRTLDLPAIAALVPEDADTITRLMELTRPAPEPAAAPDARAMPHAVTFFLTEPQKNALHHKLRAVNRDRNLALVQVLQLDIPSTETATE